MIVQVLHPLKHVSDAGEAERLLHVAPGEDLHHFDHLRNYQHHHTNHHHHHTFQSDRMQDAQFSGVWGLRAACNNDQAIRILIKIFIDV